MQGVLFPNGNALCCRPYTLTKIESQRQRRNDSSPNQRVSVKAHILRSEQLRKSSSQKAAASSKGAVSTPVALDFKSNIAEDIILRSKLDWQKFRANNRTREYLNQQVDTTYSSLDDCSQSTPPPHSDSSQCEQTDTEQTSSHNSENATPQMLEGLVHALKETTDEVGALQATYDQVKCKLQEQTVQFDELKAKYDRQLGQRKDDFAKVTESWEYCQEADARCKELDARVQALLIQQNVSEDQHKFQLAQINGEQQYTIDTLEENFREEIKVMQVEAEQARVLFEDKYSELRAATKKAIGELQKVTKTSESNRRAWKSEKKQLELTIKRMDADSRDANQRNEDEIERLVQVKRRLELEVDMLFGSIRGNQPGAKKISDMAVEVHVMQKQLDGLRRKNTILEEKVENTLESMQQERDHWDKEYDAEKKAQTQVTGMQQKVAKLEGKLARQDELLRLFEEQGPRTESTRESSSSITPVAQLLSENNELRHQLEDIQEEKAKMQTQVNKLDDLNLDQALEIGFTEKQLREQGIKLDVLQKCHAAAKTELKYLNDGCIRDNEHPIKDNKRLRKYLRKTTDDIQLMTTQRSEMHEELTGLREIIKDIQDKADTEVMKATKESNFWYVLYYDEAVAKVEALYEEIIELNAQLGRDIRPKEQLVRNQRVADRSALRFAAAQTLVGVDTEKIPAEYYEPGFVGGWIPATNDALRVLRPLGWVPVANVEKVYLQPMYKPFTEEDAAARIQAREQQNRQGQQLQQAHIATSKHAKKDKSAYHRGGRHHLQAPERVFRPKSMAARVAPQASFSTQSTALLCNSNATPSPPMYEPRFIKFMDMTKEMYNELEDDNKWDYIKMLNENDHA